MKIEIKKIILFFFSLFLPYFLSINTVFAEEIVFFNDVPISHPNYFAIKYLKEKDVVSGINPQKFNPEGKIDRASILKIVMHAFEIYDPSKDPSGYDIYSLMNIDFKDVQEKAWYLPYLRVAKKNGILTGYDDGTFKPAKEINLAEALKIILTIYDAEYIEKMKISEQPFPDIAVDLWYSKYFAYAKEKNLLLVGDDGLIKPGEKLSRGEVAEIIYRLLIIREKKWQKYNLSHNWPIEDFSYLKTQISLPPKFETKILSDAAIIFKKDSELEQKNYFRIYPKTARIILYLDSSSKDQKAFFEQIKKSYLKASRFEEKEKILRVFGEDFIDYYYYLDKDSIITAKSDVGSGPNLSANLNIMEAVIDSIKILENGTKIQDFLSRLRANIAVEGAGKSLLAEIKDKTIIHTDALGVGTGPVDYYYSATYKITIKYERKFDEILNIKDGKTTKF